MKIKLDSWAIMPTRAHDTDAGLDLYATEDILVPCCGLNVKHGITSDGVVDVGYTGSIRVKLYNHSDTAYRVKRGDKISQLVIVPVVIPPLVVVDELEESERGDNGFGSTGR